MNWCIWLCKDTNLKANHNQGASATWMGGGVYDSAKILIWKQITTSHERNAEGSRCIWLCKDTNLKANHNIAVWPNHFYIGVYDSAKILIWKQITTSQVSSTSLAGCIWLCKDTNLKANHNAGWDVKQGQRGVYDSAKILIWKQITTESPRTAFIILVYMTLQRY